MFLELSLADWIDLLVTVGLAAVGLYLANNISRQTRMRVAERRLEAYARLWAAMHVASPTRLARWNAAPLTYTEREELFRAFTAWYYEDGNGMLLEGKTRALYLRVKDNLICPLDDFEPAALREAIAALPTEAERACARGFLAIRHLSLLRTRLKADLDVFGPPYHRSLSDFDRALLASAGEDIHAAPWESVFERVGLGATHEGADPIDPLADCRCDEQGIFRYQKQEGKG